MSALRERDIIWTQREEGVVLSKGTLAVPYSMTHICTCITYL